MQNANIPHVNPIHNSAQMERLALFLKDSGIQKRVDAGEMVITYTVSVNHLFVNKYLKLPPVPNNAKAEEPQDDSLV
tara:strand:- start:3618 stop:3848 length:231 start_codon:yes stop_codon:yes gene_type:complete